MIHNPKFDIDKIDEKTLNEFRKSGVIVFGTGNYGILTLHALKQKNIKLIFLFIIFIIILKIIMNYNIVDNLFIEPFEFLKNLGGLKAPGNVEFLLIKLIVYLFHAFLFY